MSNSTDFLDKASIIRLTISFLKLRQFSVNGHPPWAPDFTTLGSINPYSSQSLSTYAEQYSSFSHDETQSRPTSVANKQIQNANLSVVASNRDEYKLKEHSPSLSSTDRRLNVSSSNAPSNVAFPPTIETYQHHQLLDCHPDVLLLNDKSVTKNSK